MRLLLAVLHTAWESTSASSLQLVHVLLGLMIIARLLDLQLFLSKIVDSSAGGTVEVNVGKKGPDRPWVHFNTLSLLCSLLVVDIKVWGTGDTV